jgi:hypothetical protein
MSQTGGQWYSDASPFSIPWFIVQACKQVMMSFGGLAISAKMTSAQGKLRALAGHLTKM